MKYSKDDIIEALRCCSLNGRNSCETCPLKEECEESPLESILAKYTLDVVDKLIHENRVLTEQRNTYREYALQVHAMIENIRIKENEGYELSAAKAVAEMDMWRVIAAEKQALQDQNKRLIADTEELYKEMVERIAEERKIERKLTLRRVHANLQRYTESVGECTIDNPLAETYSVVREEDIDQVINDMLEDTNAVH
jgi:exonuclease VII large subunit